MKVVFCNPTRKRPHEAFIQSMEDSLPGIEAKGIDHAYVSRIGNPYISFAMADMLFTALSTPADTFVFLDDDLSWEGDALLRLLETPGDVVAGTYRFKHDEEEYMGDWHVDKNFKPILRPDGCIMANSVPSGFLKITRLAVRKFMWGYPELVFGDPEKPGVDLFNHGAVFKDDHRWWGQDYAFCRRWSKLDEKVWLIPDLSIHHNDWNSDKVYKGNLHQYLLRQPGGSLSPEVLELRKKRVA